MNKVTKWLYVSPCLEQGLVNCDSRAATVCILFVVVPSISHTQMYCELINVCVFFQSLYNQHSFTKQTAHCHQEGRLL